MSLFVIVIVALPILIIVLHSTIKSSFYRVIIEDKANKNKIKLGIKNPPPETEKDKMNEYLKISSQVKCINMTVNYLTAYLVFITIVYLITIL